MAEFTQVGVEAVVKGHKKFMQNLGSMAKGIGGVGAKAAKFAVAGVAAAGAAIVGLGAVSIKTAVEFESAWTGVVKTTEGLVDELGELTPAGERVQRAFRDLATEVPTSVEELMRIGELGGQLGVAEEDLIKFTRVIADMGESTDLTTDAAATQMAKFANVMGTTTELGVEGYERLGSTIVMLGNNLETNEPAILSFAQRIAGAGEIAGLTEAEVLGIGAAFSSVGVEAEAGGTAVQKVLLGINTQVITGGEDLEIFAATAGLSAEEFAAKWETDAGAAFQDFVSGLGMAGDDAILILDELGLKDQRLIRSFLSLANAGDKLTESIDIANEGWREGTALQDEAAARYRTTESQFKLLKNTIKDVAIEIGMRLLPVVNTLVKKAVDVIKTWGKKVPEAIEKITPIIEKIVKWVGDLLPKAIKLLTNLWETTLLPAIRNLGSFITGTVIPALKRLFEWFSIWLPLAVSSLVSFWETKLLPAIQSVRDFFETKLIPAFQAVGNFIKANMEPAIAALIAILAAVAAIVLAIVIPAIWAWVAANVAAAVATITAWAPIIAALALLGAAVFLFVKAWKEDWGGLQTKTKQLWENTLKPFFEGVKKWIETVVIPAIEKLVKWFKENLPKAMEAVKRFWENTLKPALEAIWEFIEGSLIPIVKVIFDWLKEKIPEAFQAIKDFWESTLKPTLEALWAFVRDNIIPIIEDAYDWLKVKIPEAFQAVKDWWESTLKPALDEIWAFIKDNIIPIIEDAYDWLKVKIPEAFEVIKKQWTEILRPVLKKIWEYIEDPVILWLKKFWSWISEKVPEAFGILSDWWNNTGRGIVELIAGGIGAVVQALRDVVEWVGKAIDALKNWKPPSIKLPNLNPFGSGAMTPPDDLSAGLTGTLGIPPVILPSTSSTGISPGNVTNITLAPTLNGEMDVRAFEQRVIKIITNEVG